LIPKFIHQIWLGGALPDQYQAWRDHLVALHPGWDVRLWTEQNLPDYDRIMDRYDLRGYHPTIASDLFRVLVVLRYGGIYLDCDTEPIACLEPLRGHSIFCRYDGTARQIAGRELRINSGHGVGAAPGNPILAAFPARCDSLRQSQENILYRVGFLGLSEHLWHHRESISLLPQGEVERYYRHEARGAWTRPGQAYRPIFTSTPLQEPFKKTKPPPAPRPWPTAEEMLQANRSTENDCCSRPSNLELRRK